MKIIRDKNGKYTAIDNGRIILSADIPLEQDTYEKSEAIFHILKAAYYDAFLEFFGKQTITHNVRERGVDDGD